MTAEELTKTILYIVNQGIKLKNTYTNLTEIPIDFVCILSQTTEEYEELEEASKILGSVIETTQTGNIYKLHQNIHTQAGELYILKIRVPDPTRPHRGDPDFRIENYELFKRTYLKDTQHFKLIKRAQYEMIELSDTNFDVHVFFPNIPYTSDIGRKKISTT